MTPRRWPLRCIACRITFIGRTPEAVAALYLDHQCNRRHQ